MYVGIVIPAYGSIGSYKLLLTEYLELSRCRRFHSRRSAKQYGRASGAFTTTRREFDMPRDWFDAEYHT
jgi:hypothetical protein